PADQNPADYQEIASVGRKGVKVLISDSTNAVEPGHTVTEQVIAENLDKIIREATGRLIITSFASLIGRLQQIMDSAIKANRKIFLSGRSMEQNVKIAQNLGYIKVPRGVIGDIRKMSKCPDEQLILLTTGSQGEDMSALARMATGNHAKVTIKPGDTVVLSSNPIIGNGPAVVKVLNGLARLGAKIITNKNIDIHTSGHAKQEDLKLMIKLIKPEYLIPCHGDYYMRFAHQEVAECVGIPKKNVFLVDNGGVIEGDEQGHFKVTNEKIPAEYVMVEGRERSEVGSHILMDRQLMAENGAVSVVFYADKANYKLKSKPTVESRGFVYMDMSSKVIDEIVDASDKAFRHFVDTHQGNVKKKELVEYIQHNVDRLMVRMLDKRPSIIPVIVLN
ncbi:MAG: ribonuclease J, partial [Candidatus Peregrinibacteria bacterium]|nr:ribonuclease J [Candidatus Peregrinibacteria bacterium]